MYRLVLASSSSARSRLLKKMSFEFDCVSPNIVEQRLRNESIADYVKRLSFEKTQAIFQNSSDKANLVVIAADTVVSFDNKLLEKPKDKEDCMEMLSMLSGKTHKVYTGLCVFSSRKKLINLVESLVTFCNLTENQIQSYWKTGEPINKSGCYAIQGIAGNFVSSIEGSYSSVVGLPIVETRALLNEQGVFGDF